MSTIRTDNIQTTDNSVTLAVEDIASYDMLSSASPGDGASLISMGSGESVEEAVRSYGVTVTQFGAAGDGVTDDSLAIQSALDFVESAGGGTVVVPWPSVRYRISTGILIPNKTRVVCEGMTNPSSTRTNFVYSGTGVAFALKGGESLTGNGRAVYISNVAVELESEGATGLRLSRCRDITHHDVSVYITAANQIGIHYKAEQDGGVSRGVFDVRAYGTRVFQTSTFAGTKHYLLTGADNGGQCNSNTFFGIRSTRAGTAVEVGPSFVNAFYGLQIEAPTDDFIVCNDDAESNRFYDVYAGDADPSFTGKIFRCTSGAILNGLINYRAGENVNPSDVEVGATNFAVHGTNDIFRGGGDQRVVSGRVEGVSQRLVELRNGSLRFGDGTVAPSTRMSINGSGTGNNVLTLASSVTPDLSHGQRLFLNINNNIDPTIEAPIGMKSDVESFDIEINNTSGGARTLSWGSGFLVASSFPSSISSGERITARFAYRANGNIWVQIGQHASF